MQRVSWAGVTIGGEAVAQVGHGLCILLGVAPGDTEKDVEWLADKTVNMRIFDDEDGKMNRSLLDECGEALVVSQFTLFASCRKGRRPSWGAAAEPRLARRLYEGFIAALRQKGVRTDSGVFQAHMVVGIENDGPVTILIDSRE